MEWRERKAEKEGETSLLFTLMPQYSLLRGGGQWLDHPICCQCLHVSQLIFLTKSRIIFQLPFILSFPVPHSLYHFLSFISLLANSQPRSEG